MEVRDIESVKEINERNGFDSDDREKKSRKLASEE